MTWRRQVEQLVALVVARLLAQRLPRHQRAHVVRGEHRLERDALLGPARRAGPHLGQVVRRGLAALPQDAEEDDEVVVEDVEDLALQLLLGQVRVQRDLADQLGQHAPSQRVDCRSTRSESGTPSAMAERLGL